MKRSTVLICTICLGLAACRVLAAVPVSSEAAFLSQHPGVHLESFEGVPTTQPFPTTYSSVVTSPFTLSSNATSTSDFQVWETPDSAHATDGAEYVVWKANTSSNAITFKFNSPVDAFGVNIVNWGYPNFPTNDSPLTFSTDRGDAGIAAVGPGDQGNVQFFGIVSAGMTQITFARTNQNEAPAFDEVYFGSVPEPATVVLLGVAAIGPFFFRRR